MKNRLNNSAFISLDLLVAVVLVLVVLMLALQIIPALNPPVPETNMKQVLTATRTSDILVGDRGWRAPGDPNWEESWNNTHDASRIGFALQGSPQNTLDENKVSALMYEHKNDTPANWWNSSWLYRQRISITNNNNTLALYDNYSVSITVNTASLIAAGKMLANGSDLRITYWNETSGEVEIDRVNETDFNTASTEIWFRAQKPIPQGKTDENYSMYYGNPNPPPVLENKSKIYLLWEPFNNTSSWTNWTNGISQPEVSLLNGAINISNKGWTKRKQITINGSSTPQTDYTVMLNVAYDSDMQIDFSDLRFNDTIGAEISYWIENKVNSSYANVWVKVPSIPASSNSTIYMYYGNPNAVSQSNGTKTFDFFDDFEDGDADGWTLGSDWSVQNIGGNYVLRATSNNVSSSPTFTEMNSLVAEYRFKYPVKTGSTVFNMSKPGNTAHFTHVDDVDGQYDIRVPTEDAANTIVDNNWTFDNGWHATKLVKNGTFYQQWLDGVDKGSNTSPPINVSQIWVKKKGASWAYNESQIEQSTTQTAWQDAANLTFTSDAGDYIVVASFELSESIDNVAAKAQLIINGVSNGSVFFTPWDPSNRYNMGWIKKVTFTAASQTIKVQFATNSSAQTAYIRNIHIFAWKAPTFQYSENETEQSFSTTEINLTTLTFTPASDQKYLILASFEGKPDGPSNYPSLINFRLKVDGTEKNWINYTDTTATTTASYRGNALMLVQNLTAASHTITITGQAGANTMYARKVRVAAIPLGTLTTYNSSAEAETSTTLTTYQDKLNYSTTISTTANHVVFGSSENKASSNPYRYNNLIIDGAQSQESKEYSETYTEYVATFSVKNLSLASGSHTFKIQHKVEAGYPVYTVYTKNARIIVIQMPSMDGYFDDFRVRKYTYPEPSPTIGEEQDVDAGMYHKNFSFNSSEGFLIKERSRSIDWEGHAFAYWLANISNISGTPRISSAYFARDGIMAYLSKRNGTSLENISVNLSFQIPGDWYTYEVFRKEDGGMRVLRNGTPLNLSLGWVYDTNPNLNGSRLAIGRWGNGSSEYDWLLVRKYLDPEPSTSLDLVDKWMPSSLPWWEFPVSWSTEAEKENASRALGLAGYDFYMQLRPLNETIFNEVRANYNIIRNVPDSGAAVVERYVFIRGSEALVNASGKTAGYRLVLWVW